MCNEWIDDSFLSKRLTLERGEWYLLCLEFDARLLGDVAHDVSRICKERIMSTWFTLKVLYRNLKYMFIGFFRCDHQCALLNFCLLRSQGCNQLRSLKWLWIVHVDLQKGTGTDRFPGIKGHRSFAFHEPGRHAQCLEGLASLQQRPPQVLFEGQLCRAGTNW